MGFPAGGEEKFQKHVAAEVENIRRGICLLARIRMLQKSFYVFQNLTEILRKFLRKSVNICMKFYALYNYVIKTMPAYTLQNIFFKPKFEQRFLESDRKTQCIRFPCKQLQVFQISNLPNKDKTLLVPRIVQDF